MLSPCDRSPVSEFKGHHRNDRTLSDSLQKILTWFDRDVRFVPCVDSSELARDIFTFAELVGAAMAGLRGSHDRWP